MNKSFDIIYKMSLIWICLKSNSCDKKNLCYSYCQNFSQFFLLVLSTMSKQQFYEYKVNLLASGYCKEIVKNVPSVIINSVEKSYKVDTYLTVLKKIARTTGRFMITFECGVDAFMGQERRMLYSSLFQRSV